MNEYDLCHGDAHGGEVVTRIRADWYDMDDYRIHFYNAVYASSKELVASFPSDVRWVRKAERREAGAAEQRGVAA